MNDTLLVQLRAALGARYLLERELGGGGMSRVFLAGEPELERQVVIKVLPKDLGGGTGTERFRREILLAARLQHPNIVPLITAGEIAGQPYFVMPYVAGESLRARLDREPTPPLGDVLAILRDVARALAYAHDHGVIHRDIKPGNILLSGGAAVVTDFGVAKALAGEDTPGGVDALTLVGTSLGTPSYMAPEQAAADPATDHRADLYAFGVVAYEMLVGRTPFAGRSPQALMAAHLTERPAPLTELRPEVPPGVAGLVMACLEKEPAARPQAAAAILALLDAPSGSAAGSPTRRATPAVGRRIRILLAGMIVVSLAVAGWWQFGRGQSGARPAERTSLAVLPLVTLSGADEYFADGLTDELTAAMAHVPGLRVASRTSSFTYKGRRDVDVRQIGRQLRVGTVLEGTVSRDGQRLRLNARLTSTTDGFTIWSETYQRSTADLFAVQDELAAAVAGALRGTLVPDDTSLVHRGTGDLAAYDLYLRGRFLWRQRGAESLRLAAGVFGQAIARDSSFPHAWAGLADALSLLPLYGPTPADSVFAPARAAAERAIALDSTLSEAHATLGQLLKEVGAWRASEGELRRAVTLDSTYAPAHQWLGELLYLTGRPREAVVVMRQAAGLEPASPIIAMELGYVLALAGAADSAAAQAREAIALAPESWPAHAFAGATALVSRRPREAVRELERAARLEPGLPDHFLGLLGMAYGMSSQPGRADSLLRQFQSRGHPPAAALALVSLGLGRHDDALVWLERAVSERDPFLFASSLTPPWYAPLREDPRFTALARRMGLDPALMAGRAIDHFRPMP